MPTVGRGPLKHHQRLPEPAARSLTQDELIRRVHTFTIFNVALAALILAAVSAFQSQPTLQGWTAAAGAAIVFGGSSIGGKHPAAAEAGSLGFQLWVTVGNAGVNLLLLLLLGVPIQWSAHGTAGAGILTATQLFAWPAILRLGAAVGPGVWCGIGMCTSFVWGVVVFDEPMRAPPLAAAALVALVSGVGGIASSQVLAKRHVRSRAATFAEMAPPSIAELPTVMESAASDVPASSDVASEGHDRSSSSSSRVAPQHLPLSVVGVGIACAVATGLFDGSLMAPFSAFRRADPAGPDLALRYLGGFALALPLVALLPLLLLVLTREALSAGRRARHDVGFALPRHVFNRQAACIGMSCGGLWASANVLSVHATMRLGQAVGFPLTQVCVVISALWGICYFGELRESRAALALFGGSSVVVLSGAVALKLAGGGAGL